MTGPASLTADDAAAFLVGLELLGAGGGGDPAVFGAALRHALEPDGIQLHDPAGFGDAPVVPVAVMGATRVMAEKLPSGQEIPDAVQALTRWTGVTPAAVVAVEVGGLNGVVAVLAAAALGLPLLDTDLMGRAFPRADQTTHAVTGGSLTPFVMVEPGGRVVLVDRVDPTGLERVVRAVIAQTSGWAGCAFGTIPASRLQHAACAGSLSRALRLGQAHTAADPADVATALGGRRLAAGRVLEIARRSSAGFGTAGIALVDDHSGAVLRLEAENEYLLAFADGEPVASTPDLLCVLNRRTAAPIAVDGLREGDDVTVLVLPGPQWWTATPERLAHVDPRAFGLDCDPVLMAPAEPVP
ncbi:DUF917 domain-containing protein [Pseudonocardia sp. CA-107938]|uniref:DUF917 domain-containing protein n=1 Tax=Pseudonocardia sp. CA-107938 TaxID=3240021 RepID=UPI003D9346AF